MSKKVIVTGGSGKVGRYVIEYLLGKGHQVLNLDIVPLTGPLAARVHTLKVDLTNSGEVFSSFTSHFRLSEPFSGPVHKHPDAVIHLAGYARNMIVAENETFRGNILATYNVVEAACKLGVPKIILASSVCVYGVTYAEGDVDFASFPVDEELEVNPMDVYSISKHCGETLAAGFARRFRRDIYVLRIGAVVAPDEYGKIFDEYVHNPGRWKVHGWSYIDARDLGQMCYLGVEKDGLGFQIFNATNDEITSSGWTPEFLQLQCPQTPFTRAMGPKEAPMSNRKIKELLGFQQEHNWQKYYTIGD